MCNRNLSGEMLIGAMLWLCRQVTMVDRGAAERACKDANPIIDGRKANVNLAYLGAKPRSSQTSKCVGPPLDAQKLQDRVSRYTVCVPNLLIVSDHVTL